MKVETRCKVEGGGIEPMYFMVEVKLPNDGVFQGDFRGDNVVSRLLRKYVDTTTYRLNQKEVPWLTVDIPVQFLRYMEQKCQKEIYPTVGVKHMDIRHNFTAYLSKSEERVLSPILKNDGGLIDSIIVYSEQPIGVILSGRTDKYNVYSENPDDKPYTQTDICANLLRAVVDGKIYSGVPDAWDGHIVRATLDKNGRSVKVVVCSGFGNFNFREVILNRT